MFTLPKVKLPSVTVPALPYKQVKRSLHKKACFASTCFTLTAVGLFGFLFVCGPYIQKAHACSISNVQLERAVPASLLNPPASILHASLPLQTKANRPAAQHPRPIKKPAIPKEYKGSSK